MAGGLQDINYYTLSDFLYRGEGNANLVIAHLKDEYVIRFHKQSKTSDIPVDGGQSRVIREINFIKYVLIKFLSCYVSVPEIIYFNNKTLDNLINVIRDFRPVDRLSKSTLEPFATKMPDYTLINKFHKKQIKNITHTFCVEIKPKQGYVCEKDRYSKCHFCLKQFYKAKEFSNITMSSYCPLDLFSGNENRMNSAIFNLIENPQNNFKVFKNGICCFDHRSNQIDLYKSIMELFNGNHVQLFPELLVKTLLHPFSKDSYSFNKSFRLNDTEVVHNLNLNVCPRIDPSLTSKLMLLLDKTIKKCDFNYNILPKGCVLESILNLQKLHQCGEDVVYAIYKKYCDVLCDDLIHENLIKTFKNTNGENNSKLAYDDKDCESDDRLYMDQLLPSQRELEILQNYLLFNTAKDCSIMISVKKIESNDIKEFDNSNVVELSDNCKYLVDINITDVDLKSVHCVEKHCKREHEIIRAAISMLKNQNL